MTKDGKLEQNVKTVVDEHRQTHLYGSWCIRQRLRRAWETSKPVAAARARNGAPAPTRLERHLVDVAPRPRLSPGIAELMIACPVSW